MTITHNAYDELQLRLDRLRSDAEEADLRVWLEASGWSTSRAAEALGCGESTLRRCLARHPDLVRERAERGPGRGWPLRRKRKPA